MVFLDPLKPEKEKGTGGTGVKSPFDPRPLFLAVALKGRSSGCAGARAREPIFRGGNFANITVNRSIGGSPLQGFQIQTALSTQGVAAGSAAPPALLCPGLC